MNVVDVCANCHRALEGVYDEDFWKMIAQKKLASLIRNSGEIGILVSLQEALEDIDDALEAMEIWSERESLIKEINKDD